VLVAVGGDVDLQARERTAAISSVEAVERRIGTTYRVLVEVGDLGVHSTGRRALIPSRAVAVVRHCSAKVLRAEW